MPDNANNLKQSELETRALLLMEHMSDGVTIYQAVDGGKDFIFLAHNKAGEQITGLSAQQVMGRRVTKIFPAIKIMGLLDVLTQVYHSGAPQTLPLSQYEDSIITIWVENSVFKLPTGEIVAIYRDITEAKQREQQLQQATTIINSSPAVAFRWHNRPGWPIAFVSTNVKSLTGYDVQNFMDGALSYLDIIHPHDQEQVKAEVARYSNQSESTSFEHTPYRIISKNGTPKWVQDITSINRDEQGNISHYNGMVLDITAEQKQQERINHLLLLRKTMLTLHRHLATITDEKELLEKICTIFVEEQGYSSAWIVLLGEDQTFHRAASAGLLKDFSLLKQKLQQGYFPPCCEEILSNRRLFWQQNQKPLCIGCPMLNGYKGEGIMAVPLEHEEQLYGVLTVALARDKVLDIEERQLLEEMARDIGFALYNRQQDSLRKHHEDEISYRAQIATAFILHEENNLYDAVLDIAQKAMASSLGVFGYLQEPDLLICPSMTRSLWKQCQMADKNIHFARETWAGIWQQVLTTGTTHYSNTPFKVPAGHVAIECSMATAIIHADEIIGLLQVANKSGGYDQQDVNLIEAIAATIAPILKSRLDKQQVEQKLQQSLAEYEDLYDNAPDMFASVEPDREHVVKCNQTLLDVLGYTREEIIGQPVFMLYHPDSRDEVEKVLCPPCKNNGGVRNKELRLQRKDGSSLPVILDVSSLLDEDGILLQSRVIWHNINEHKKLEEQLLISAKMTTIAGLAAGVAHEINTPLSGILQAMQLINLGLDPSQPRNQTLAAECGLDLNKLQDYLHRQELDFFLDGIHNSASKAAGIIADLLQFSRPQSRETMSVQLAELIERAVELSKADYDMKKEYNVANVQFQLHNSPKITTVDCVPMEIEQVLINLIKNSCQAMAGENSPAHPHIILRTSLRGDRVRIKVEDNGPGLAAEQCQHVFDPFYSTKEIGQGTGLGLAICYSIICDKHGGTIKVRSKPGAGTTLIIDLPLTKRENQTD